MNLWLVVPAAGVGRRMGSGVPKQYLEVAGATVMEHTVNRLSALSGFQGIILAVAADDARARSLPFADPDKLRFVTGGAERADSVLAALEALADTAHPQDWALVHDVARPCVSRADIQHLVDSLRDDAVGGILACPVRDTIKQAENAGDRISRTVPRADLWQAMTPQMFRYGLLRDVLRAALAEKVAITDEASALEWAGYRPRLVEGRADNIKITYPEDLAFAGFLLERTR